jgi:hypothetical protein
MKSLYAVFATFLSVSAGASSDAPLSIVEAKYQELQKLAQTIERKAIVTDADNVLSLWDVDALKGSRSTDQMRQAIRKSVETSDEFDRLRYKQLKPLLQAKKTALETEKDDVTAQGLRTQIASLEKIQAYNGLSGTEKRLAIRTLHALEPEVTVDFWEGSFDPKFLTLINSELINEEGRQRLAALYQVVTSPPHKWAPEQLRRSVEDRLQHYKVFLKHYDQRFTDRGTFVGEPRPSWQDEASILQRTELLLRGL